MGQGRGSLKNLTIGLIWLVTRRGGVGGVGRRRASGGFFGKNLTIGLIWLVTRGEAWGGWAREAGKGGRWGGGHRRAVWEQQGVELP